MSDVQKVQFFFGLFFAVVTLLGIFIFLSSVFYAGHIYFFYIKGALAWAVGGVALHVYFQDLIEKIMEDED